MVNLNPFIAEMSDSNNLTSKVDPPHWKGKLFTMVVDQQHWYSNEADRADIEICDYLKLIKTHFGYWVYKNISTLLDPHLILLGIHVGPGVAKIRLRENVCGREIRPAKMCAFTAGLFILVDKAHAG